MSSHSCYVGAAMASTSFVGKIWNMPMHKMSFFLFTLLLYTYIFHINALHISGHNGHKEPLSLSLYKGYVQTFGSGLEGCYPT